MNADMAVQVLRTTARFADPAQELPTLNDSLSYVERLIDASRKTIDAFKALGNASGVVNNHRAQIACESAMQAQADALSGWPSRATNDQSAAA